ncbi:MAG: hypothetical protein ABH834_02565 [Candidatus Altiarchaeota archaeon]
MGKIIYHRPKDDGGEEREKKPAAKTAETVTTASGILVKDKTTLEQDFKRQLDTLPPMHEVEGINPAARDIERRARRLEETSRELDGGDYFNMALINSVVFIKHVVSLDMFDPTQGFLRGNEILKRKANDTYKTYGQAVTAYEEASEWEKAAQLRERIIVLRWPKPGELQGQLEAVGQLYARAGKPEESRGACMRLLKQGCPSQLRGMLLVRLAEGSEAAGDRQDAVDKYRLAGKDEPVERIFRELGDTEGAAQVYSADGRFVSAARLREAEGNFHGAAVALEKVDKSKSAAMYERAGEEDEAKRVLRSMAKEQEEGNLVEAARTYDRAGELGEAVRCMHAHLAKTYEMIPNVDLSKYLRILESPRHGRFVTVSQAEEHKTSARTTVEEHLEEVTRIPQVAYYSDLSERRALELEGEGKTDEADGCRGICEKTIRSITNSRIVINAGLKASREEYDRLRLRWGYQTGDFFSQSDRWELLGQWGEKERKYLEAEKRRHEELEAAKIAIDEERRSRERDTRGKSTEDSGKGTRD